MHEISDKIHKRSLIVLFTDMFQSIVEDEKLFEAVRHLKFNKHEVIIFHVYDSKKSLILILLIRLPNLLMLKQVIHISVFPNQIQKITLKPPKTILKKLN